MITGWIDVVILLIKVGFRNQIHEKGGIRETPIFPAVRSGIFRNKF